MGKSVSEGVQKIDGCLTRLVRVIPKKVIHKERYPSHQSQVMREMGNEMDAVGRKKGLEEE